MKIFSLKTLIVKVVTIAAFFVLAFGIPACNPCDGVIPFFDIQSIEVGSYKKTGQYYSKREKLSNNDFVSFNDHMIVCDYNVIYYSQNYTIPFATNSVYARTCEKQGYNGSEEGINAIYVITTTNYNAFAAGDTINSIVEVGEGGYYSSDKDYETLNIFTDKNKNTIRSSYGFNLRLTEKPQDLSTAYSFTVVVELGNGEIYDRVTPKVYFK